MPRNFRIYRTGKPHGELSSTLAVGTERDDGTCTVIIGGGGHEIESVDAARQACETLSSSGVDLIYDDEVTP